MTIRDKRLQINNQKNDLIVLYLKETAKLTFVLYTMVILVAIGKWLLTYTGNYSDVKSMEKLFYLIKSWSFALLLIERFVKMFSVLLESIVESFAVIVKILKSLI